MGRFFYERDDTMRYDMPTIETSRCILRPVEESDACDMYEYYSNHEVTRYLSCSTHKEVDETLHYVRRVLLPYEQQQDFETLAIVLKENDKMIGDIQFHSAEDDRAQIGYTLSQAYWNQGIMKEVLPNVLKIGFTWCGLRRVEALYDVEHVASAHVLAHSGFRVEGILQDYTKLSDNKYHDLILAAILKKHWKEQDYEQTTTTKI